MNEWKLSNGKWDWPKIRAAYISGRWPDFEQTAKELKIKAGYLRAVAAREQWGNQRAALEQRAEADALARVRNRMSREMEARFSGLLDTADVLRFKGLEFFKNQKAVLNGADSIRALALATEIEREIYLRRGRPIEGGEEGGNPAPAAPPPDKPAGLLAAPATLHEISDEHLIRIIDERPRELVGRKPIPKKDGDHASGSGKGGAKAKGGKG